MAPTKTVKSKHATRKSDQRQTHGPKSRSSVSKSKNNRVSKLPPPKQQKTKSFSLTNKKGKRKIHTEEELGIPKLNMITPTGIRAPSGKKKGKIFIDDPKSMMTILALVNADKEGQIESKMMKARQMEEIREARRKEAEQREQTKKNKLEETKNDIKKRRKKGKHADVAPNSKPTRQDNQKPEKRVAFAKSTIGPI